MKTLTMPTDATELQSLCAGDMVLLNGPLLTGRDAAHKRMNQLLDDDMPLPVPLDGQGIYYVGPCPAPDGYVIGSCGPTTSERVDRFTPRLLDMGLKIMVGKGNRSPEVVEAMRRNGAVYFAAIGGAGALYAQKVTRVELCAFEDLGTEAIRRMWVCDFPVVVAIDCRGESIYKKEERLWD